MLKSVIHDWDDEQSIAVLRNCHRALKQHGTLLVIERVLPDRVMHAPEVILQDLHMLAITGGRERNGVEYRALLAAAGFRLTRIIPARSGHSIIEGVHAEAGIIVGPEETSADEANR
jgi:hypothetical protein